MSSGPWPILLTVRMLDQGGCERDLARIAMNIDRSRFTPHVGCFFRDGVRLPDLTNAGIPVVEFPLRGLKSFSSIRNTAQSFFRYVRRHKIQLIHTYDGPSSMFLIPLARLAKIPILLSSQLSLRELNTPREQRFLRFSDRFVHRLIVNSKAVLEDLAATHRVPRSKLLLLYNGVDTHLFHPGKKFRPVGLEDATVVIGSIAALREEKQLHLLLEGFARVRNSRKGVKLLMVGGGLEEQNLKTRATELGLGDSIVWVPAQTDVTQWMRAIDIFVLPSRSESFPNGLLEAMASGCCPVGSDAGGIPELIEHEKSGLLFPSGDSGGLAERLHTLLSDDNLRVHMANAAVNRAHTVFALDRFVATTTDLYGTLLSGSRGNKHASSDSPFLLRTYGPRRTITCGVAFGSDAICMLFNSLTFLLFFPIVTAGYYLLARNLRLQNLWLLAASLFFYSCWDWRFTFLLLVTVFVDFYVARYLDRLYDEGAPPEKRKKVVAISMGANLTILGFFKYFNFFVDSVYTGFRAIGWDVPLGTLNIVLPIGISFYTFQSMSYTIDVYRRELPSCKSVLDFTLFVSFYPHLVAGPIMRAVDLLPQILRPRRTTRDQVLDGIHLIIWGFWKKVFVADNLAPIANRIFGLPNPTGFETLMGVYAFAFQIYCDFSGYTDIARGIAKLMGFELVLNFNLPYFSTSPREFWTRWHISLSSWLRNYLYIPLGGSRGGEHKMYRNLMLTMILGGLWHGAAWNFVLWGFYQGGLLVVHRLAEPWLDKVFHTETRFGRGLSFAIRVFCMFQLTCFGWLLFRATSFDQIRVMTGSLFSGPWVYEPALAMQVALFALPLLAIQCLQYFSGRLNFLRFPWMVPEIQTAAYAALAYFVIFKAAKAQSFIYFQF